ncbi:MAG: hybrid sensor histidine kinase/response regulator [Rubritepida sp.]|nr:hybrid sensor histidine kinase/response regulator [Rubritepida sp.]
MIMTPARRIRLLTILGLGLLLLAQVVAVGQLIERAHHAAINAATGLADRISRSVEAAVNRSFVQVDATLVGLPLLLAPLTEAGPLNIAGVNAALRQINSQNFAYRDLLLIGADGRTVAAALPASRRRSLPVPLGPDYVDTGLHAGGLTIGGPAVNPATGESALFFARPLQMAGFGRITGVAEVPISILVALLGAGGEAPGLRVWIEREDGTILAAIPEDEGKLGQRLDSLDGPAGAAIRPSRMDGRDVITATRPSIYPNLRIVAEMDLGPVLADWRQERNRAILFSIALALLLMALMISLLVWLRQRDEVESERLRWRQRLESALNSMTDGFVMFGKDDRLIVCNQSYRDMYALSAPFMQEGAAFEHILREGAKLGQYPQLRGDIETFINEMQEHRSAGNLNLERLLPDGRWVLINERRMPDGGSVGVRTDITALKSAMCELATARDDAEKASLARGMFLARMSHELRTPLNAVLGFAQILLQDRSINDESRDRLRLMHDAAAHLRDVVNTLLDLTKAEAGKLELSLQPTPLRPLAEACIALVTPDVERKRIAIALDVDAGLPVVVMADAMRLRQVLLNLLSNAVKFSPQGGRVALRLRKMEAPGMVRFEVEDSGHGIPQDQREKLFRDFSQLTAPTDPEAIGTGLGLAISAQLIGAMGGRIGIGDGAAQGALFWAEVPLPEVLGRIPEAKPAPARQIEAMPEGQRPLRLLVVDDIAVNRTLARVMLEQAGHAVTLAANGEEALATVQTATFDAVLMDVQMPLMDGLEATRRIRALPGDVRHVPIIALTASAMVDQVEACRAAGMDAHLAKPINRVEMLAVVAEIARRRHGDEPASPLSAKTLLELREQLGTDAASVIAELFREVRDGLRNIPTLATALDIDALASAAHRLLGPLRTLGAEPLALATVALEAAARSGEDISVTVRTWRRAAAELEPHLDASGAAQLELHNG